MKRYAERDSLTAGAREPKPLRFCYRADFLLHLEEMRAELAKQTGGRLAARDYCAQPAVDLTTFGITERSTIGRPRNPQ